MEIDGVTVAGFAEASGLDSETEVIVAVPRLLSGLFPCFGYVPVEHDSPVLAVDGLAMFGCRLLGEASLQRQRSDAIPGQ